MSIRVHVVQQLAAKVAAGELSIEDLYHRVGPADGMIVLALAAEREAVRRLRRRAYGLWLAGVGVGAAIATVLIWLARVLP